MSLVILSPEINRALNLQTSVRTIQRTLRKLGLFYGKVKKLQRLSKAHKQMRVAYATERKDFDYSKVLSAMRKHFSLEQVKNTLGKR